MMFQFGIEFNRTIISNTCRKVVHYILKYEPCRFIDIVNYTHKVLSTISWHLSWLIDLFVVVFVTHFQPNGRVIKYIERSYNLYFLIINVIQ